MIQYWRLNPANFTRVDKIEYKAENKSRVTAEYAAKGCLTLLKGAGVGEAVEGLHLEANSCGGRRVRSRLVYDLREHSSLGRYIAYVCTSEKS